MDDDYDCINFNELMKANKACYRSDFFYSPDQNLPTVLIDEGEVLSEWLEHAPPFAFRFAANGSHQMIVFDSEVENWVVCPWSDFRRIVKTLVLSVINEHRRIRGMQPRGWDHEISLTGLRQQRFQRDARHSNAVQLKWRHGVLLESLELDLSGVKKYRPTPSLFLPARALRLGKSYSEKQLVGLLERRYNW